MTHQNCRSCGAKELVEILDLGFAPPSNALLSKEDLSKGEIHYPLVLLFCQECKLVQTRDFHSGEALFTPDYPYLSSTSTTWIKHSHELVDSVIKEFHLDSNSLVAEIASNDGYLLERLAQQGIPAYGIEPTKLAADISIGKGHHVYNCFLNLDTASKIKSEKGAANVVIANNVFAHVPELRTFTEAAKSLLADDGILVIEVQYFGQLLKLSLFDTVYHEHYSYFTVTSMTNLLQSHGMGVFQVERVSTHGGSVRFYARNNSAPVIIEELVVDFLGTEQEASSLQGMVNFQGAVLETKKKIKTFIGNLKRNERKIAGSGAAAKASTLINFLKLGTDEISYLFDSAPSKHGKFIPGSHIPVYPTESIPSFTEIDIFIIFPWNISQELIKEIKYQCPKDIEIYQLLPDIKRLD